MTAHTTTFELLKAGALREVLRSPGPCITMTLPPYRPGEPGGSSAAFVKAYIQDAASELRERGFQESANLLQPLQHFAEEPALSAGSHCGRIIFCSPGEFVQFSLTTTVAPHLSVSGSFFIRHCAPELSFPHTFYVLALAKTQVRLLRCEGLHAEPATLPPNIPETLEAALALERPDHDLEARSAAGRSTGSMHMVRFGTGSEREHQKIHLADYYKLVDRGMRQMLREPETPLILAGVEEDVAIYRAVNTFGNLAKASIPGSPDISRDQTEILRKAYSILHRERSEHQHAVLLATQEQSSPSRFSTDLNAILKAAFEGRVAHLYLREDASQTGVFEYGTYQGWGEEDLLNLAAVQTLIHRGTFCELPSEMMPDGAAIAILRFQEDIGVAGQ